jgi:hypothetical protein
MNSFFPIRPRTAIWYFVLAYWVVTLLGILLIVAFAMMFKPPMTALSNRTVKTPLLAGEFLFH